MIASVILISPYYRTSAYWALDENYSFISLLISFLFLNKFIEFNEEKVNGKKYLQLLLLTFFSSLCVYFDPRLIIIPIICLFKIIRSEKKLNLKMLSILFYMFFSLPYIYLIILWDNIIPPNFAEGRGLGSGFFFGNIGYLSTMIAFYLFPLLFLFSHFQLC